MRTPHTHDSCLMKVAGLLSRDAVALATEEVHKAQQELTEQEGFMRQKQGLQDQVSNLRHHNEQLAEQIAKHRSCIQPLEAERQQHTK